MVTVDIFFDFRKIRNSVMLNITSYIVHKLFAIAGIATSRIAVYAGTRSATEMLAGKLRG